MSYKAIQLNDGTYAIVNDTGGFNLIETQSVINALDRLKSEAEGRSRLDTLSRVQDKEFIEELAKRYKNSVLIFESTVTGEPFLQSPTKVFIALGLLSWAKASVEKIGTANIRPA